MKFLDTGKIEWYLLLTMHLFPICLSVCSVKVCNTCTRTRREKTADVIRYFEGKWHTSVCKKFLRIMRTPVCDTCILLLSSSAIISHFNMTLKFLNVHWMIIIANVTFVSKRLSVFKLIFFNCNSQWHGHISEGHFTWQYLHSADNPTFTQRW